MCKTWGGSPRAGMSCPVGAAGILGKVPIRLTTKQRPPAHERTPSSTDDVGYAPLHPQLNAVACSGHVSRCVVMEPSMKYGTFDDQHGEYVIERPDTPRHWSNYIGSADFFGGGCE